MQLFLSKIILIAIEFIILETLIGFNKLIL